MLVKYTFLGNAKLDDFVNADDYGIIDRGFVAQPANPTWEQGNFNYDAFINADDYGIIDRAFIGQSAGLAADRPSDVLAAVGVVQKREDGASILAELFSVEPVM